MKKSHGRRWLHFVVCGTVLTLMHAKGITLTRGNQDEHSNPGARPGIHIVNTSANEPRSGEILKPRAQALGKTFKDTSALKGRHNLAPYIHLDSIFRPFSAESSYGNFPRAHALGFDISPLCGSSMEVPITVVSESSQGFYTASFVQSNALKDKDGNSYTVKTMLDGKRWMTQNLNTRVTDSYCFDDKQANCDRYGRLYTFEAARKTCEMLGDGWHLPSADEWREMAKHYGGVRDDSGKTGKEAFTALLTGGSSGFNALLGGNRDLEGKYARFEAHGFYWSATEHGSFGHTWYINFAKGSQALFLQDQGEKARAWTVRCMKP